jgi:O-antigen ligase
MRVRSGLRAGVRPERGSLLNGHTSDAPQDFRAAQILNGAFFWLSAFYLVYCARPQELIPGLGTLPVAKLTAALALVSLGLSVGRSSRKLSNLPREAYYLIALIGLLFVSALLSPVWRGGAFFAVLDFSKVCVLWVLAFLVITSLERLRRVMYIQAASVAIISAIALFKGYSVDRLSGVVGGIYSNPNDLAFAIVLSLPLGLALLLTAKGAFAKVAWCLAMLMMGVALLRTASRAGFIDLLFAGTVCLWQLGIKARRFYLIPASVLIGAVLLAVAGGALTERLSAASSDNPSQQQETANASYAERRLLMGKALDAITQYPLLGVGAENFVVYSGLWLEVHAAYLQIAVEGGIPVLILYLLFFYRGFANLCRVQRTQPEDDALLFRGALLASLIGFVIGAAFSPEAYHFFPYLTVCYTSVLLAIESEKRVATPALSNPRWRRFDRPISGLARQRLRPVG